MQKMLISAVFWVFLFSACGSHPEPSTSVISSKHSAKISIAAFNARALGSRKVADAKVLNHLVQIFSQFDMIFIQEIRDLPEQSMTSIANAVSSKTKKDYAFALSKPLGDSSNYIEYYAYLYRTDLFSEPNERDFKKICGSECQSFLREPYIINFTMPDLHTITFFGAHLQPSQAKAEIEALGKLADTIEDKWKHSQTFVLGDLNADCRYVSRKALESIREETYLDFTWRIKDGADTTSTSTHCAYDRIMTKGRPYDQVVSGSEGIYEFDKKLYLTPNETSKISDHYPVHVDLQL